MKTAEMPTERQLSPTAKRLIGALAQRWTRPIRNPNRRVGRNAKCPCGSGTKFKNCHGKAV